MAYAVKKSPESPQPSSSPDPEPNRAIRWYYTGTLLLIVLIALFLRVDDLIAWFHQPHRAFFNGQPILINFDGYYYLSLARDLISGSYGLSDSLRGIPNPPPSSLLPPLLPVITAGAAFVSHLSLNWVATLLPPLLGVSLMVPMVLISRLFGGRLMAIVAVSMALFANDYVYRSHLGWFDTDCLNVSLLFMIIYLFIRFGLIEKRRRYFYLLGGIVGYLVFLWWWDQTPAVVSLLCLLPLVIVSILYYRPQGRERFIVISCGAAIVIAVLLWLGPQVFLAPFKGALQQWGYIAQQHSGDFPNVGVSVHEQKRLALNILIQRTTGHFVAFGIGLVGIFSLFWQHKRKAAALVVPFAVGCLTFALARRFLIFLNPMLALGLGFVAQLAWDHRHRLPLGAYVVPVAITLSLLLPFKVSWDKIYWPKEVPPLIEGMDTAQRILAEDAVLWAWWDHGYPIVYWSKRATINDGSLHGGLRTVSNALPMASNQQRFAANFMHFYVQQGMEGIGEIFKALGGSDRGMQFLRDVFSAEPQRSKIVIKAAGLTPTAQWEAFLFAKPARDVYLFLDLRVALTTFWWSWFGSWDVGRKDGDHARFKLFLNCRQNNDVIKSSEVVVDMVKGRVIHNGRDYRLSRLFTVEDGTSIEKAFSGREGLVFVYHPKDQVGALMDQSFYDTNFNRLYMLNQPDPRFFSLLTQHFPYYQIWSVHRTPPPLTK